MIDIKGTTITITKGDTALITVQAFNPDGSAYEPEEGDRIRFAMKRNFYDAEQRVSVREFVLKYKEVIQNEV